jgi:hypothetical protein
MPGLREEVISIICEEKTKEKTNGSIALNPEAISERLTRAGVEASESEVRLVLYQLRAHHDIELAVEPGAKATALTVTGVRPGLCP